MNLELGPWGIKFETSMFYHIFARNEWFKTSVYWQDIKPKRNHIIVFSMWDFSKGFIYLHEDEIVARLKNHIKKPASWCNG